MKNFKCVIFDCDGVLVDSEILASKASIEMLRPYGLDMSVEEYSQYFAGKVEEDIVDIITQKYNISLPDDFISKVRLKIDYELDHNLQAISGVKDTISGIPVTCAVVSNSHLVRVIQSVKVAGLSGFFGKRLFSAEMVERPKPDPGIYLYAARQLNMDPAECLVVEDSLSGVTAAHKAGMTVVGFLGASHIREGHGENLKKAGAYTTAENMEALNELLQEIFVTA